MRSAQADTASKPASKTHLSTVEPIFSNKNHTNVFEHFQFCLHFCFEIDCFFLCFAWYLLSWFESFNPRLWGPDWAFKQLRVKPNNPGLPKNSTQLTRAVGFRETSRKHHENHRFTQLQPHLASSIFAAVECKPSVGPNCITTDSSKRSCSSVMVEAVEVEATTKLKKNNMFQWNWAYLLNFYGWCSQQLKSRVM